MYKDTIQMEPIRKGLGKGLVKAGQEDERIVALCADLTESTQIHLFKEAFPERFVQVGIAEQNLISVASGMAAMGKIAFASSFAAFNPGRSWEQIRTTVCLNDQPVIVVGSHAGLSAGADGATHQMLEDIAITRALPNMTVVVPTDSLEAEKATLALAKQGKPAYIRLCREATPVYTTPDTPFEIGKAYIVREGHDVTLIGTGVTVYECLQAARELAEGGLEAQVISVPTISPLDRETIIDAVRKTGRVVTVEEAQINGGLGSAIAETLGEELPMPLLRLGMNGQFGESGTLYQLLDKFGLTGPHIAGSVREFVRKMPRYHQ